MGFGGGATVTTTETTYTYQLRSAIAVGVGPIDRLVRIDYNSDFEKFDHARGEQDDYFDCGTGKQILFGRFYWGTETQGVDSNLDHAGTGHPGETPNYRGICYYSVQLDLGQAPAMPTTSFTVTRYNPALPGATVTCISPFSSTGINPAIAIYDILTSARYGFGLDAEVLDTASFLSAYQTLLNEKLDIGFAIVGGEIYNSVRTALDWIEGELVYDEGKIALVLKRDNYNLEDLITVTSSEMKAKSFSLQRPSWYATKNCVYVNFLDITRECDTNLVYCEDISNFNMTGTTRVADLQYDVYSTTEVAQKVAARSLHRHSYPYAVIDFECPVDVGASLRIYKPFRCVHGYYGIEGVFRVVEKIRNGPFTWKIQAIEEFWFAPEGSIEILPERSPVYHMLDPGEVPWEVEFVESANRGLQCFMYSPLPAGVTVPRLAGVAATISGTGLTDNVPYARIGVLSEPINAGVTSFTFVYDTHYWQPGKTTYHTSPDDWFGLDAMMGTGKKAPVANAPTPPSPTVLYLGGEYLMATYTELVGNDSFYIEFTRGIEDSVAIGHGAGTHIYEVTGRSLPLYNLPPTSYNIGLAPAFSEPWPFISALDAKSYLQEFKNLLQKPLPVTLLSHTHGTGFPYEADDIIFSWTFQSRGHPAVIPESPLSYYPQDTSYPYHDQYVGYLLNWFTYPRSGITPNMSVTIGTQPDNATYVSTYASREAVGLPGAFELDVCTVGVFGYNSPSTIRIT